MRTILTVLLLGVMVACGGRKVEVGTGQTKSEVALHVVNNDNQAVNVFVVTGTGETFVGEVAAKSEGHLPVSGMSSGTQVRLRAKRKDGTRTYDSESMALSSMTAWRVP